MEWDLFRACISSVAVLAVSQPRALWIKCLRFKKKTKLTKQLYEFEHSFAVFFHHCTNLSIFHQALRYFYYELLMWFKRETDYCQHKYLKKRREINIVRSDKLCRWSGAPKSWMWNKVTIRSKISYRIFIWNYYQ